MTFALRFSFVVLANFSRTGRPIQVYFVVIVFVVVYLPFPLHANDILSYNSPMIKLLHKNINK